MAGRLFLWDEKNGLDLSNAVIASAGGYCETTETWILIAMIYLMIRRLARR
jgi:hypothetical protein